MTHGRRLVWAGTGILVAAAIATAVHRPAPAAGQPGQYSGWIRFVHLSAGTGPLRFVARNMPNYSDSYVEVVLGEGESSGYLRAPSVKHHVSIWPAPAAEVGGFPLREPLATPRGTPLVADFEADVYHRQGCTVVARGARGRPRRAPDALSLARVVDLPSQGGAGQAPLRFYNAVVGASVMSVDVGAEREVDGLPYGEPSGYRLVPSGNVDLRVELGGRPVADPVRVRLPDRWARTVFLYGSTRPRPGLRSIVQADDPVSAPGE
jgi:hypothetical protein